MIRVRIYMRIHFKSGQWAELVRYVSMPVAPQIGSTFLPHRQQETGKGEWEAVYKIRNIRWAEAKNGDWTCEAYCEDEPPWDDTCILDVITDAWDYGFKVDDCTGAVSKAIGMSILGES